MRDRACDTPGNDDVAGFVPSLISSRHMLNGVEAAAPLRQPPHAPRHFTLDFVGFGSHTLEHFFWLHLAPTEAEETRRVPK
jgi:hypothetical protein